MGEIRGTLGEVYRAIIYMGGKKRSHDDDDDNYNNTFQVICPSLKSYLWRQVPLRIPDQTRQEKGVLRSCFPPANMIFRVKRLFQ